MIQKFSRIKSSFYNGCNPLVFLAGIFSFIWITSSLSSCNRHIYDESVTLEFSTDTLLFDTVFTTIGSITRNFTVYNPSTDPVKLNIYLAGGNQSYYSINVNGKAGVEFQDVEIPAQDSIFVFVKVNINPTNQNTPYVVTDSILFCNKNQKQVMNLVAFGQDAHFILPDHHNASMPYRIVANANEEVHWTNDKPWVIYGWAVVDSLGKLIIDPGTQVYVHKGGGIWVYRYGNIHVNGTPNDPVRFRGDRLEHFFDTDYAQWDRIWINEGTEDNIINHAIISNATIGVEMSALTEYLGNKTIINNSIIHDNYNIGVLGWAANIEMNNCQVSNNGECSIQLQVGNYKLNHVTAANYYAGMPARKKSAVAISNFFQTVQLNAQGQPENVYMIGDANVECNNCIFYGNLPEDEFSVSTMDGANLSYTLRNCLVKKENMNSHFVNCINANPMFISDYGQDYNLKENSPAIDAGWTGLGITDDILGRARMGNPDIGAFEYYPAGEKKK